MKKLMIITLGTGQGVENGIAKSIDVNNPDSIIFVMTPKSQEMPDKVAQALKTLYHKEMPVIHDLKKVVENESIVEEVYQITLEAIKLAQQKGYSLDEICLDFTSGTKAMSVGASLAVFLEECKMMSYIGGFRRDKTGRVITGSEFVLSFTPNEIFADYKQRLAKRMFNNYQFDAGLKIIQETQEQITLEELSHLELVFRAYERWDKFDHVQAQDFFEYVPRETIECMGLGKNKGFVTQIAKALEAKKGQIIPELIVDLLVNAQRRAEEGKYDDAVARLYRVTELIAQYRLQEKGLDTSDIQLDLLPEALRLKYEALRKDSGKIQLSLAEAYTLLSELGEQEFCNRYHKNARLKDQLKKRNSSILAHGVIPVGKEGYEKLYEEVKILAQETIQDMNALMQRATMVKLS